MKRAIIKLLEEKANENKSVIKKELRLRKPGWVNRAELIFQIFTIKFLVCT